MARLSKYSIDACVNKFEKEELLKRYPDAQIRVEKVKDCLESFLRKYWERYREARIGAWHKMCKSQQTPKKSRLTGVMSSPKLLEMMVIIAGLNDAEPEGQVLPIILTDRDEHWDDSKYRLRSPNKPLINSRCGVFCGGVHQFADMALGGTTNFLDDFLDSSNKLLRNSEDKLEVALVMQRRSHLLPIITEITDMKERFDIRPERANGVGLFSSGDLCVRDGVELARLLIEGTSWYFADERNVGGPMRVCTIGQLEGIKCLPFRQWPEPIAEFTFFRS